LFAALVALLVLLGGCASTNPYRISGEPCAIDAPQVDDKGEPDWEAGPDRQRPCSKAWQVQVKRPAPFSMNFVEIDEQGLLANRRQAEAALANAAVAEAEGAYVVVYVHGWHHNAATDDANVQRFYSALAAVSRWNPSRKVKGIYVGWRGDSLALPLLRYTTFWDRKDTSDEVGRGALLEFLLRLERSVKGNPAADNKLVVIGHSFGASVTFNALAHVYLERFIDGVYATHDGPRFRGYGDLVVLVNPAIEAMRYMPLQSAIDYYTRPGQGPRADFSHEQRPALVVLSSLTDKPTRVVFPAARFFSTLFEAHNRVSEERSPDDQGRYHEWNMDRDTLGNYADFKTHHPLHLASAGQAGQPGHPGLSSGQLDSCRSLPNARLRELLNSKDDAPGVFPESGIVLQRKSGSVARSPYVVADVAPDIIDGHNDIGRPNLVCWVNQLIDTRESTNRDTATAAGASEGTALPDAASAR
jgi:hypothetical protein